jgi:serine/threonine protein phosphatase PrpC
MGKRWREFAYQVRGKSHVLDGRPGQDRFKYEARHGIQVLCLADGAGSASHSEHGAQTVVAAGCDFVLDCLGPGQTKVEELDGRTILGHLLDQLNSAAVRLDCDLKDLASTFLCVALTDGSFFAAQIGDGVIGAERDGELEVVTSPDNGEFANVTTFVTSRDAAASMQIVHGDLEGYSGLALRPMSVG